MAQFAKSTFSHSSYAVFRPVYPPALYETILKYHQGQRNLLIDLGCGHGIVARSLSGSFTRVIGSDPSKGMIEQARSGTPKDQYSNITYTDAMAEDLAFVKEGDVDAVVAGQAAHWFDHGGRLWPEMKRVLRSGGTVAFWGYKDHCFVDHPEATRILSEYTYGKSEGTLGPYWSQPGRSIVQNKLRDLQPPEESFENVQRIEYEPGLRGSRSGEGTLFLSKKMQIGECMNYVRTWSSYSAWQDAHPDQIRKEQGGTGDVVDELFDAMRAEEPGWQQREWKLKKVDIEWGSGLLLARRK